jgi:serine protease Do
MEMTRRLAATTLLLTGMAAGLLLSGAFNTPAPAAAAAPGDEGTQADAGEMAELRDFAGKLETLFRTVADEVSPAVVLIESEKIVQVPEMVDPFEDFFFGNPFGSPFGGRRPQRQPRMRERRARGLGSGCILDAEGHVLTNNHVVGGADELKVTLTDGRTFEAEVVGADEKTDLAVIRIIDGDELPVVKLGDSDDADVGEWVIAVGNPFGLRHTVSAGIISATGRAIGKADYESMIQTDAAINRGNSGGPLVNLHSEVIGINTAIVGQAGNIGIGFAIPVNMAKDILDDLIAGRPVVRGYLGVYVEDLRPEIADAFNFERKQGALVNEVAEGSPAEKAGVKAGDIIYDFDGDEINSANDLRQKAAASEPGERVRMKVWRDGEDRTVTITPTDLADAEDWLGLQVQALTREEAKDMGQPDLQGVVVTEVADGSPAEGYIVPGDIIMSVNKIKVSDVDRYMELMTKVQPGSRALLYVLQQRSGRARWITAKRPDKE